MRLLLAVFLLCVFAGFGAADQPAGIRLNPNGTSLIYPVTDSSGWILTQPQPGRMNLVPDNLRETHFGDDYFAQDWSRGCGQTLGQKLYAGISGRVVWAGDRGPYGRTVVIHDADSGFALKYSHLDEIHVANGQLALAGMTIIGRVGRTGNVSTSGCGVDPGAHLHLALYKNVSDPAARPVTTAAAGRGQAPSIFSAAFGFTAPFAIFRTSQDPTVFVEDRGLKIPVTAAVFESHGLAFDRYQSVFDPLAGRVISSSGAASLSTAPHFWPPRSGSLVKGHSDPTVYTITDGHRRALSYQDFVCRGLRFSDIRAVPDSELQRYPPGYSMQELGCRDRTAQAVKDLAAAAAKDGRFGAILLGTYAADLEWDRNWELRYLAFRFRSGTATIFHAASVHNSDLRLTSFWDPDRQAWTSWQQAH